MDTVSNSLETANTPATDKPWLWKPGQSGNPAGRPKFYGISDALRMHYSNPEEIRKLILALAKKANSGSLPHIELVLNRLEGRVDVAEGESGPMVLNITISAPRPSGRPAKPIVDVQPAPADE
jgi:hypothetical protein